MLKSRDFDLSYINQREGHVSSVDRLKSRDIYIYILIFTTMDCSKRLAVWGRIAIPHIQKHAIWVPSKILKFYYQWFYINVKDLAW